MPLIDQRLHNQGLGRAHYSRPEQVVSHLLAVQAQDYQALSAGMYRGLDVDKATLQRADEVIASAVAGNTFLTREELRPILATAGVRVDRPLQLIYLVMHAELTRTIISGPRKGKRFSYAVFGERVPVGRSLDRDEALAELGRRYATGRGPVTERDLARWSGLTLTDARRALVMAG